MKEKIKYQFERHLLHLDGDAFFVGVEQALDPTLRGKAVVTGGERGIVTALSYEAKALGVKRGMPVFKLKKTFPSVIVLAGDYASYAHYSSMMFDIVRRYADEVEEYSIDECFADMTGLSRTLKMTPREIALRIQNEIRAELHLSVTIGLAPTKVLAKVASKWKKPCGLTEITEETRSSFLERTPIESVWGIGPRSAVRLRRDGMLSAFDFAQQDLAFVRGRYAKPYVAIWMELCGVSVHAVNPEQKTTYASMQETRTFHPATSDETFLWSQISKHAEAVCRKARHYHLAARHVGIFLKTEKFSYVVRRLPLLTPSNNPEMILPHLKRTLSEMREEDVRYRATGVTLFDLVPYPLTQPSLFGDDGGEKQFSAVHQHLDLLEKKLGACMVHLASTHQALGGSKKGSDFSDPDRNLLFL